MPKLSPSIALLAAGFAGLGAPAAAAILGPHAADCAGGSPRAAMLVRVIGLKNRAGLVRVQSYGGDPASYFSKGAYLERVDIQPPANGPVEVCMPVQRGGIYAVSVKHMPAGPSESMRLSEGGGLSGNPNLSLLDALFRRKPSPTQVQVRVQGVTSVSIVMNYVQGASLKPIASLER